MQGELLANWNELVKAKEEFLSALQGLSEEQIKAQPTDGWSAGQVLEHVLDAEMGTLGYMKKKSSSGWNELETAQDEHHNNSKAINTRLASEDRYKAPAVLTEPSNAYAIAQLTAQWDLLRNDMYDFLKSVQPEHYNKLVFKQPIAGMLNVVQAVSFMHNHLRHHVPQIIRLRKELSI
jgi:DinB superfamily